MPQQNQRLIGLIHLEGLGCAALAPALVGASSLSFRMATAEYSRAQYMSHLQRRHHTVFVILSATAADSILPPRMLHSLSVFNSLSTGLWMVSCWQGAPLGLISLSAIR